ncbi:hypothetical protein SLS62_004642 [Diatrype stigma]|uniref:Uncharacterized protein n=1 Tax=Diatrype stigma TaxID=117547 RepID=A0AAN9UUD6_9PEZI
MEKYKFPSEPEADPRATVVGPNYRFTILSDIVLRYEWSHDGVFEDRASTFAINRKFSPPQFKTTQTEDRLAINTPSFRLTYDKQRFSPNGLHVDFVQKGVVWGSDWRYGGPPDKKNLGGTARTLDEADGRIDMGTGILSRSGYANLDDSESMLFDGQGFVAPRRPGDRIDGYLFFYGQDYKTAMKAYYAISGQQPRLPRWAFGNWWSRYHAYSADEYLALMDKFAAQSVPLSVAVLDMDWHLVKDPRVQTSGWTGYTWNRALFPDPDAFGRALRARKLKVTLNDHPSAGVYSHEDQYEAMAAFLGRDTSDKAPIIFDPTSPRFMYAYLNILHRSLEPNCDFWWIDWQQGSYSAVPGIDPLWLLNHFQYLDSKYQSQQKQQKKTAQNSGTGSGAGSASSSSSSNDALIFSRYAGPGSHRYPVGFSGDTVVTWASLAFQPEFTATASNVGYGWWSHDIGGHMQGYRDDELTARWAQLGAFSPVLRLHSSDSPWTSKEPWRYRPECAAAIAGALRLRHRLVPYLYAMDAGTNTGGEPLVQPLYWAHPGLDAAYAKPNEYYFGTSLVVAPVTRPRDGRTNHAAVAVWVPLSAARHVDIFTGLVYDGDREVTMYRPLQRVPVLAPEGAIIPLDANLTPGFNGCANPEGFEVLVVVGRDGEFYLSESASDDADDDVGETAADGAVTENEEKGDRIFKITYDQAAGRVRTNTHGKAFKFKFVSLTAPPSPSSSPVSVTVNGVEIDGAKVTVETYSLSEDSNNNIPGLVVELPEDYAGDGEDAIVEVTIGPDPQLGIADRVARIGDLLYDFQVEYEVKDRVQEIISSQSQPIVTQVSRLATLGLPKPVVGPILELLTSDSRQS